MQIVLILLIVSVLILITKRAELVAAAAKLMWQRGNLEKSLSLFAAADKIGTLGAGNLMLYGYILLRTGDCDGARTVLTRASMSAAKPPLKKRIKSMLALVEWKSGNLDLAIEMLEEVIADFKTSMIYQDLGLLYILSGDREKTLSFNKEAYDYNSDDLVITDNMAEAYALCGENEKAAEIYEKLLEKEPHFPEAYYGYGLLLIEMGERERGIELIRQSLDKRFSFLSVKTKDEVLSMLKELENK